MVDELFPIIATTDVDRALTLWCGVLGGRVTYRFPPEGAPQYVGVDLGGSQLGIGLDPDSDLASGAGRISVWCYVDDCDAVVERIRAAGLPVRQEPVDEPWGERVARVEDPDGNRVIIGARS